MQLILKTPPTSEPLGIDAAKDHARIDSSEEDTSVAAYLAAARSHVENFTKRSLLPTVWTLKLGAFPSTICLPVGPVLTTDALAITYQDTDGVAQVLSSSLYQTSLGETGVIRPAYGETWPSTRDVLDAVSIDFTAGYAAATSIPAPLLQAVRLLFADYFENREQTIVGVIPSELPTGVKALLLPWVRWA